MHLLHSSAVCTNQGTTIVPMDINGTDIHGQIMLLISSQIQNTIQSGALTSNKPCVTTTTAVSNKRINESNVVYMQ
jgi:hypothetical protein